MMCALNLRLGSFCPLVFLALFLGGPQAAAPGKAEIQKLIKEGRLADAEQAARALHESQARDRGPRSLEAAAALDLLVKVLWEAGKAHLPESLGFAREALEIKEALLGPDDPAVAASLNQAASLLDAAGDLEEARRAFERALAIREKAYGPSDPRVANALNNLAFTLKNQGEYAAAKPLFERALAIWEEKEGQESPAVATGLDNLAQLLHNMGDHRGARPVFERSVSIAEKREGPFGPGVAVGLNNLARLLHDQGDLPRARASFERALGIWEKTSQPNPRELASCLNNLGWLCRDLGLLDLAQAHLARALALREKHLGRDHPDTIWTVRNTALLRQGQGRLDEARDLLERAQKSRRQALGPDHPFLSQDLVDLAELHRESGANAPAFQAALAAEAIAREHLRSTARGVSERLSLVSAAARASGLDILLTLAAAGLPSASLREVWDALVRSRGLVLDEISLRHRQHGSLDGTELDPEVELLSRSLASARRRLANLLVRGPGGDRPSRHLEALERARKDRERAEELLASKSPAFRTESAREKAGLDEVRRALPPRSALIAFARHRRDAPRGGAPGGGAPRRKAPPPRSGEASYLAFLMHEGSAEPEAVPLGGAAEIEALVSRFQFEASRGASAGGAPGRTGGAEAACRRAGEALRRKVWDPLAGRLAGVERVFLVPDGALHLVSFAALPSGDSYLVETGPLLHYLSAEKDLIPADSPGGEGLLVVGGPAFDDPSLFAALTSPGKDRPEARAPAARFRGARPACPDFQSARFEPLPASAREAEEVASVWREAAAARGVSKALVLEATGGEATEAAFKEKSPGRQVLHLATHGFFLGEGCASPLEGTRGFGALATAAEDPSRSTPQEAIQWDNPLSLSGLVLAGANHRSAAGPDEEDGIVTAEEISSLDLSGVEWAVLSACDTGAGRVQVGEGVLGLRRAFQMAGARTLILSLWAVEDAAARTWMARLYRARLLEGMGTAEAVREASLWVLARRRKDGESTHPFHWAAFVAAGDWR